MMGAAQIGQDRCAASGGARGLNSSYVSRVCDWRSGARGVEAILRGETVASVDVSALTATGAIAPVWLEQVELMCAQAA